SVTAITEGRCSCGSEGNSPSTRPGADHWHKRAASRESSTGSSMAAGRSARIVRRCSQASGLKTGAPRRLKNEGGLYSDSSHHPFSISCHAGTQMTLAPTRLKATQPPGLQCAVPQQSQISTCVAEESTSKNSMALISRTPSASIAVADWRPCPEDEKSKSTAIGSISLTLHMVLSG